MRVDLVRICRAWTDFFHITKDGSLPFDTGVYVLITVNGHVSFVSQSEMI